MAASSGWANDPVASSTSLRGDDYLLEVGPDLARPRADLLGGQLAQPRHGHGQAGHHGDQHHYDGPGDPDQFRVEAGLRGGLEVDGSPGERQRTPSKASGASSPATRAARSWGSTSPAGCSTGFRRALSEQGTRKITARSAQTLNARNASAA